EVAHGSVLGRSPRGANHFSKDAILSSAPIRRLIGPGAGPIIAPGKNREKSDANRPRGGDGAGPRWASGGAGFGPAEADRRDHGSAGLQPHLRAGLPRRRSRALGQARPQRQERTDRRR